MNKTATIVLTTGLLASAGVVSSQTFTNASYSAWIFDGVDTFNSSVSVGGAAAGSASLRLTDVLGFNNNTVAGTGAGSVVMREGATPDPDPSQARWQFDVSPLAGWSVNGVSLYSTSTDLANPSFINFQTDGLATVTELTDFFSSHADGDGVLNGATLTTNVGSGVNGWPTTEHREMWSIDSAGGTSLAVTYSADPTTVSNILAENMVFDAQLTQVPEPSAGLLGGLAALGLLLRRRR